MVAPVLAGYREVLGGVVEDCGAKSVAEVAGLDTARGEVVCRLADGGEDRVGYDHLVLALGSITRLPDVPRWLDALEAGARDYCGAPFECIQLRWILGSITPGRARLTGWRTGAGPPRRERRSAVRSRAGR